MRLPAILICIVTIMVQFDDCGGLINLYGQYQDLFFVGRRRWNVPLQAVSSISTSAIDTSYVGCCAYANGGKWLSPHQVVPFYLPASTPVGAGSGGSVRLGGCWEYIMGGISTGFNEAFSPYHRYIWKHLCVFCTLLGAVSLGTIDTSADYGINPSVRYLLV